MHVQCGPTWRQLDTDNRGKSQASPQSFTKVLPQGDQTLIGDRGINLSGKAAKLLKAQLG